VTNGGPGTGHIDDDTCQSILAAMELVGGRWTGSVLFAAVRGARRYSEYRAMVTGISDPMLTRRLRKLQAEGLIRRTVIPTMPVQVIYSPTAEARELIAALEPLSAWGLQRHLAHLSGRAPDQNGM
jgi:DNA-binding HxlR family transcriptional regulator